MDDREIVELFGERSEDAVRELDSKYGRLCRRIAGNILEDSRDAEECVNDCLMTVWNQIPPDQPEQLSAYVCKIVRNTALDRLDYNRAKKRSAAVILPIDECAEWLPDEEIRADRTERELGAAISRYLRSQKPERANIFIRRYTYCEPIKVIAGSHHCSEAKVRNLLARMRGQLKEQLKKEGYLFHEDE